MILTIFLVLFSAQLLASFGFNRLNHCYKSDAAIHPLIQATVDSQLQQKMQRYTHAKSNLECLSIFIDAALLLALIFLGPLSWFNDWIQASIVSPIWQACAFFFGLILVKMVLDAPLSLYQTFHLEQRFGFNKQSLGLWLRDRVVGLFIGALLGGPVLIGLVWIMLNLNYWYLYAWLGMMLFGLLVSWIFPTWIAPLFNKFEPLKDETLREKIHALAKQIGFEVSGIFQMDASKRSGHSNAYFTGFGKTKRIVLFDTLLDQLNHDQLLAVLGHEIGHFKLKHIWKTFFISQISSLLMFVVLAMLWELPQLYSAFSVSGSSVYMGLFLVSLLWGPVTFFLSPFSAWLSRKHEYEADNFAKQYHAPEDLAQALVGLAKDNLSNLHPHPLYVKFYYSHPTLQQRLDVLG